MQILKSEDLTLLGVLETHFHADFVSGHREMGERLGAKIYFGPTAGKRCKFPMHELKDNEVRVPTVYLLLDPLITAMIIF